LKNSCAQKINLDKSKKNIKYIGDSVNLFLQLKIHFMKRTFGSGTSWEERVGYSRAVRTGPFVEVAGTTAMDGNNPVGRGDLYAQTVFILKKIEKVLAEAGASLRDVVRTRMYVTDISRWEEAGRAHEEFFGTVRPASTMIEVQRLVGEELLIEIEVSAIVES
jgi:enamine deaminase RidA (YjgF/YER057c/UK114 family)